MNIITPNIAIFKEGEMYVYQLPDKPHKCLDREPPKREDYPNSMWFNEAQYEYSAYLKEYNDAVSYARAHPFKVHEKDKSDIIDLIKHNQWLLNPDKIWQPKDLTEYRIEGLKFKVEEIEFGHVDNYNEPHGFEQVACLIEDDGVKEDDQTGWSKEERDIIEGKVESPSEEGKEITYKEILLVYEQAITHFYLQNDESIESIFICKAISDYVKSKLEKSDQEALANQDELWKEVYETSGLIMAEVDELKSKFILTLKNDL